jgi:hypothetical protein
MMTKSHFIPTPGIEQLPHYFIIQKLIEERIRSILQGDSFMDKSHFLVGHYTTIPTNLTTPEQVTSYTNEMAKTVLDTFKEFEKNPEYHDAILQLKPYENTMFQIISTTYVGVQVMLKIEDIADLAS